MYKRIVILLSVLLCAVIPSLSAAAQGGMELRVEDVRAALGSDEPIRVPVYADRNSGYVSALLTVEWDPAALELSAVEYTDLAPDQGNTTPANTGSCTLRVGSSARRGDFTGTGVFLTLVFRAADGAQAGAYPVSLSQFSVLDTQLNYVAVSAAAGKVTLFTDGEPLPSEPATSAAELQPTPAPTDALPTGAGEDPPTAEPTEATEPSADPTAGDVSAVTDPSDRPASPDEGTPDEPTDDPGDSAFSWLPVIVIAAALCAAAILLLHCRKTRS